MPCNAHEHDCRQLETRRAVAGEGATGHIEGAAVPKGAEGFETRDLKEAKALLDDLGG